MDLYGMGFVLIVRYGQFEDGLLLTEEAARLAPHDERTVRNVAKARAMLAEDGKVKPG